MSTDNIKWADVRSVHLTILFFCVACCFSCQNIEPITQERLLSKNNLSEDFSLPKILESSDFVVIAYPTSSRDIGMTNVFKVSSGEFLCNCQETVFSVLSVLKGDAGKKTFSLLHYNVQTNLSDDELGRFEFAKFVFRDQSDGPEPFSFPHNNYLLYLNKISPNQFVPATGQDRSAFSAFDLCNNFWTQFVGGKVNFRYESSENQLEDPFDHLFENFDALEKDKDQTLNKGTKNQGSVPNGANLSPKPRP